MLLLRSRVVGIAPTVVGRTGAEIWPENGAKVRGPRHCQDATRLHPLIERVGISTAGTSHADRLCQDAGRIGSALRLKPLRKGMDEMNLTYPISGAILTGE